MTVTWRVIEVSQSLQVYHLKLDNRKFNLSVSSPLRLSDFHVNKQNALQRNNKCICVNHEVLEYNLIKTTKKWQQILADKVKKIVLSAQLWLKTKSYHNESNSGLSMRLSNSWGVPWTRRHVCKHSGNSRFRNKCCSGSVSTHCHSHCHFEINQLHLSLFAFFSRDITKWCRSFLNLMVVGD